MTKKIKWLIIGLSIAVAVAVIVCVVLGVALGLDEQVQSITLGVTYLEMNVGDKAVLEVVVTGKTLGKDRRWTSSNENVATVDSNGEVTAVASGAATVTLVVDGKFAVCTVYVKPKTAITIQPQTPTVLGVSINTNSIELELGQQHQLFSSVSFQGASGVIIVATWESMDTSIATVENGLVTAVGVGATVVVARAGNKIAVCEVKVKPAPDDNGQELLFKTLDVNDNVVTGVLSNDYDEFSFEDEIVAGEGVTYSVCRDLECTQNIPSKVVSLEQGYNKFYVLASFRDNTSKLYRVTIRKGLYVVTFDTDGGSPVEPLEVKEGETITLPNPLKYGYTFLIWTCNGNTYHGSVTVTEDMNFLAKYEAVQYLVTVVADGCDAFVTGGGKYVKGDEVTVTAERQRLGYEFLGWYDGETKKSNNYTYTFEMPVGSVTLTAKYLVDERIANLDFTSTATTFTIRGFKEGADTSELVIPEYTTNIAARAFSPAKNIGKVTWLATDCLPVISINERDSIFDSCSIGNLYFDKTVTKLAKNTFWGATILNTYYNGSIVDWCEINFESQSNPLRDTKNWYVGGTLVEDLVIPEGVKEIKREAFVGSGIKSVIFPKTLVTIRFGAFFNCQSLSSISWTNDGIQKIEERAFAFCEKLSGQITLSTSLLTLSANTFYKTNITSVVIPISITSIESSVFDDSSLKDVYYLGPAERWNNINLRSPNIGLKNATVYFYSISEPALNDEGTDYVGNYWHYVNGKPEAWEINRRELTIETVADGEIVKSSITVYDIDEQVTLTASYKLGYDFVGWYDGEVLLSDELSYTLAMPASNLTLIAKFQLDPDVANLDFESTADTFVIKGFTADGSRDTLIVPNYATLIKTDAFSSCYENFDIQTVIWRATDLSLDSNNGIFRGSVIRNFILDVNVTAFPVFTFFQCDGIENLRYSGTIYQWCQMTFTEEHSSPLYYSINWYVQEQLITELVIPDNISVVNEYAFAGARRVTSVTVPQGITKISDCAFLVCRSLTTVNLPSGLIEIGEAAFSNCNKLTSCNLPQSLTRIGHGAFALTALEGQVVIPNGVTALEDATFDGTEVSSIVIPASVSSIGLYEFRNAPLNAIYYCGTAEQWEEIACDYTRNPEISNATLYYYSEIEPALNDEGNAYDGNYWRYLNNQVVVWTKEDND